MMLVFTVFMVENSIFENCKKFAIVVEFWTIKGILKLHLCFQLMKQKSTENTRKF